MVLGTGANVGGRTEEKEEEVKVEKAKSQLKEEEESDLLPLNELDDVSSVEVDHITLFVNELPRLKEREKAILLYHNERQ